MSSFVRTYGKALVALAVAVAYTVQADLSDGHITPTEWVGVVTSLTTAVGVYLVPIHPAWTWTKSAVAILLAAETVVATVVAHGSVSTYDLTALVAAVLTAFGVSLAPANSSPPAIGAR